MHVHSTFVTIDMYLKSYNSEQNTLLFYVLSKISPTHITLQSCLK